MARKARAISCAIPGVLAAAAGIVAVGLLGAPIATEHHASGCFMTKDGSRCVELPDPTEVGCPAGDFQCYFDRKSQDSPPPNTTG